MPADTKDSGRGAEKGTFSDVERAAMRERVQELKADKLDGESAVQAKIAEMPEPDRSMAARLHTLIRESAPMLSPKTWYGMPAYANQEGKVICFFQPASKFGAHYGTLGFNDMANLDDGNMWPVYYAITALTSVEEAQVIELIKKAVS